VKLFNIDRYGAEAILQPYITKMYFSNMDNRPAADVESSRSSLRGTLKSLQVICSRVMMLMSNVHSLQSTLFQILNSIVRASPEGREAVLAYFSRIISLNLKRTGLRVWLYPNMHDLWLGLTSY